MARILGIDAGERRIGVAVCDEWQTVARPLAVFHRGASLASVLAELQRLANKEQVESAVVGLPLNADGSEGLQARRARNFARAVRRTLAVPVALWDERLSTVEAERRLREQGISPRRVRERGGIDAHAAAVILQDFLDAQTRRVASSDPRGVEVEL